MGADTPVRLAERLIEEGVRVENFFRELPTSELDHSIYTDGSCWSVRDILAHLAQAEDSMLRLVQNILAGGGGSPEDFDLNAYNERKVAPLKGTDLGLLIEKYHANRQATADLVRGLDPEDLNKQGRHPFLGVANLADIIKMFYRHNQIHLREIRHALKADPGPAEQG
jgi:hypothetical protein